MSSQMRRFRDGPCLAILRRYVEFIMSEQNSTDETTGAPCQSGACCGLGVWKQLGLLLSAVLGTLVPHEMFMRFLGPTAAGLLATLLVAAVIEVCSEGTAPLAFELYRHTGAFGNAFAFLMGGVVTDVTELGAIWTNVGRRTTVWLVGVTLPLVFGLGWVLNTVF